MPIYKYTLTKYMKATSTWVITGISMFLVIVLGGLLPFSLFKADAADAAIGYGTLSIAVVAGITSFLSIFTSVFSGFKAATMYKDEVEDGTFLVMLSKPITRSRIIFFKWLALQTAIALYTLIVAASFAIGTSIFDKGHLIQDKIDLIGIQTLRSKVVMISLALWGILFVVSLIFSSIALLLSTRLSVGTTIGISIALGVIIPITSLVATFTAKKEYQSVAPTNISTIIAQSKSMGEQEYKKITDPVNTLYQLGVSTGNKDAFKFAQIFDLNYQITTLSEFAYDQAIPDLARTIIASAGGTQQGPKVSKNELVPGATIPTEQTAQIAKLNEMIKGSWAATETIRSTTLHALQLQLDAIATAKGFAKPMNIWGTNITNDNFVAEAGKFFTVALKSFATVTDAREYSENLQKLRMIVNLLVSDGQIVTGGVSAQLKATLVATDNLLQPLSLWVSANALQKVRGNGALDSSFDQSATSLDALSDFVVNTDRNAYQELISAIKNNNNLVKVQTADYANKYTVLWVYLAIALALVPLSYFIVRKQDFR